MITRSPVSKMPNSLLLSSCCMLLEEITIGGERIDSKTASVKRETSTSDAAMARILERFTDVTT